MTTTAQSQARPVTWEEFIALPDDDRRELIDGELVETEVPTKKHEHIVTMLGFFLVAWSRSHGAGTVLTSGYKVRVSATRGVMPDIQFTRRGRLHLLKEQGMEGGGPDLVVEVISPGSARYDRLKKLNYYASLGVPEYWLIDPTADVLTRYLLGADGHYRDDGSAGGDEVFRPSTFEGLEIPLAELWTMPADD